ncbi:hypothetical protein SEPCBS57363_006736 [Sporothrix epigloea]|uniref:DUF7730 domain-containing protein n=1 Tax=Sporothrix epigloea TaxID=1892477 RepID=A0ABP0E4K9_9PEZI
MQYQQEKRRRKTKFVRFDPTPGTQESELRWHRNADDSPLLRLPPELRNRIYDLVLNVGQIHVRHRPWRLRKPLPSPTERSGMTGEFYAIALDVNQDAWSKKSCRSFAKSSNRRSVPLPDALTPLAAVCRQLYRETATLPFSVNAWSFESAHVMERYLLRDKLLALFQRRAIAVLIVSVLDDLPSRAMEKYLGGLRAIVWKDGKKFQRWDLTSAAELQQLVENTKQRSTASSSRRGAWHIYEVEKADMRM